MRRTWQLGNVFCEHRLHCVSVIQSVDCIRHKLHKQQQHVPTIQEVEIRFGSNPRRRRTDDRSAFANAFARVLSKEQRKAPLLDTECGADDKAVKYNLGTQRFNSSPECSHSIGSTRSSAREVACRWRCGRAGRLFSLADRPTRQEIPSPLSGRRVMGVDCPAGQRS